MDPFVRHLQAAQGFLDLGLPLDAYGELEEIEPELRHLSEVLAIKVPIFRALEKWELMEVVAKELCIRHPDEPNWLVELARATQEVHSVQRATSLLVHALRRFPTYASIHYQLAKHHARLG